jgi:hypothetical protein
MEAAIIGVLGTLVGTVLGWRLSHRTAKEVAREEREQQEKLAIREREELAAEALRDAVIEVQEMAHSARWIPKKQHSRLNRHIDDFAKHGAGQASCATREYTVASTRSTWLCTSPRATAGTTLTAHRKSTSIRFTWRSPTFAEASAHTCETFPFLSHQRGCGGCAHSFGACAPHQSGWPLDVRKGSGLARAAAPAAHRVAIRLTSEQFGFHAEAGSTSHATPLTCRAAPITPHPRTT